MTYSSFLAVAKIIAVVFGLLVLVTACIAIVAVIIVFSVAGLGDIIHERIHYIDADCLISKIDRIKSRHTDMPDWQNALYQVECEINSMLNGD